MALCLILVVLLWVAFRPKETNSPVPSGTDPNIENGEERNSLPNTAGIYIPGIYSTALVLGNQTVDMEIVVDHDVITAVRLVNLDEAVATMYPLLEPALEAISSQLYDGTPLDQVSYGEENKYTSQILLNAIQESLSKATPAGEQK
ncbi:MAG: hypothetical protein IJY10_05350 [Lachnospiraceae bacterium]|nr:hypothetical protein [Lachnospiraceae bacterium]